MQKINKLFNIKGELYKFTFLISLNMKSQYLFLHFSDIKYVISFFVNNN